MQTWPNVPSKTLNMRTSLVVLTPEGESFNPQARPEGEDPGLLILLHGLTTNGVMWPLRTDLVRLASKHNVVIALPDGNRSFWVDEENGLAWGAWVGEELPGILRRTLRISTRREDTFIGGFSMGGYGAFRAAFNHPRTFGGAFSLSGTLDVSEDAFRLRQPDLFRIGFGNPDGPRLQDDLVERLHLCERGLQGDLPCPDPAVRLFAACGEGDRLFNQNATFVEAALEAGLNIEWVAAPGVHNFRFWNEWLPVAMDAIVGNPKQF